MKKELVVYTDNKAKGNTLYQTNYRFGQHYDGLVDNFDRLTIVGITNEEDKTLTVGISFCAYPENFSRVQGFAHAKWRAEGRLNGNVQYKPYAIIPITEVEFTQEACLNILYTIHDELIKLSVKEVKRLVNQQIVK